ncbi:hypothetical protein MnTg04_00948 [bacterium MnTg04]|nr:hypothetical protein MnTg04_00948 [bacterium MnTg04]
MLIVFDYNWRLWIPPRALRIWMCPDTGCILSKAVRLAAGRFGLVETGD